MRNKSLSVLFQKIISKIFLATIVLYIIGKFTDLGLNLFQILIGAVVIVAVIGGFTILFESISETIIESKDVKKIYNNTKSISNVFVVLDILMLIIILSNGGEYEKIYLFYIGMAIFGMSEYINKKSEIIIIEKEINYFNSIKSDEKFPIDKRLEIETQVMKMKPYLDKLKKEVFLIAFLFLFVLIPWCIYYMLTIIS